MTQRVKFHGACCDGLQRAVDFCGWLEEVVVPADTTVAPGSAQLVALEREVPGGRDQRRCSGDRYRIQVP